MKISVQIKIVNNEKKIVLNKSNRTFEINENITTVDLKNLIKNSITQIDPLKIVEEVIYSNNEKLEDNFTVPLSTRLEYNLLF